MDRELSSATPIQYEGYQLEVEGYDALALRTFAERETITGVGAPLGVGKEGDVLEAESYRPFALKFHREGYTQFREVMKERDYTSDRDHVSWLYTARKAAERELEVLEELYPDVSVPRPIDGNRHAIVMEKFDGVELGRAALESAQVVGVLDLVLGEFADAYDAGWIHGDFSEYNIAVGESGVTIFDWPQATTVDHPNARELLERDVQNLVGYFSRKYPNETPSADLDALCDDIETADLGSVREYTSA
jgi:serine/threonine protein kinase